MKTFVYRSIVILAILSLGTGILPLKAAELTLSSATAQDLSAPLPATAVPQEQQPQGGDVMFRFMTMFLMVFVIFYFFILKPQQQKAKAHKELLDGLKKGDNVVTSGGLIGRVAAIEEGILVIELAPNVKVRVEQSHISRRIEKENPEKAAA